MSGDSLETTTPTGSNCLQPHMSAHNASYFSSYCSFPALETDMEHFNPNLRQQGTERSDFGGIGTPPLYPQIDDLVAGRTQTPDILLATASPGQPERNTTLWVAQGGNSTSTSSSSTLKKRLMRAIEYLRESLLERDVLIQLWAPIKRGGQHFLTTNNQPFLLNPKCKNLVDFRDISRSYQFAIEETSKDSVELPVRVFLKKLPEWTPDVRFFRKEEYFRLNYAQQHMICGCLAVPVFEGNRGTCLGVLEIVTSTPKIIYLPQLQSVCKALEVVNLRSCEILGPPIAKAPCYQVHDHSYQAKVVVEIQEVLKCVCDTHRLPLAQTWASCIQQGKSGCRHSKDNYSICVSTLESACYMPSPRFVGFHEACSEHHLLSGEGAVGEAFMTNQPCFASDITAFSKMEYPLSHHARMFGLRAAVAIRLRSIYTGSSADFVLELFLPSWCQDAEEQRHMLGSLSSVMQQVCQSLRVVTDEELAEETELVNSSGGGEVELEKSTREIFLSSLPKEPSQEEYSSWINAHLIEAQHNAKWPVAVSFGHQKEEEPDVEELKLETTHNWLGDGMEYHMREFSSAHEQCHHHDSIGLSEKTSTESSGGFSNFDRGYSPSAGIRRVAVDQRRATRTEKTISLQVLSQYFAGSLKDAAKSIGVCPTTLKRICRQHGITRWPSRKIKKVGQSLRKLQHVIESVQGAEGAIQLSSFYSNFPELSYPNLVKMSNNDDDHQLNQFTITKPKPELSPLTTSTWNFLSTSTLCHSLEAKQQPPALTGTHASTSSTQGSVGAMKRAVSEQLHGSGSSQELASPEALLGLPKVGRSYNQLLVSREGISGFKVKAAFGEDKIRFSIQQCCGFKDLQQEIARRFNLEDGSKIHLKYLDDESEWILLTCNADLQECIDIQRSSRNGTIKLVIQRASN